MIGRCTVWFTCALIAGCSPAPEPVRMSLIERFDSATVENALAPMETSEPIAWRFEGDSPGATGGWEAVHGITGLAIRNDRLVGRAEEHAILAAPTPVELDADDVLHAVEIRLRPGRGSALVSESKTSSMPRFSLPSPGTIPVGRSIPS